MCCPAPAPLHFLVSPNSLDSGFVCITEHDSGFLFLHFSFRVLPAAFCIWVLHLHITIHTVLWQLHSGKRYTRDAYQMIQPFFILHILLCYHSCWFLTHARGVHDGVHDSLGLWQKWSNLTPNLWHMKACEGSSNLNGLSDHDFSTCKVNVVKPV